MTYQPGLRRQLLVVAALVSAVSIACDSAPSGPDSGGGALAHPVGTPSGKLAIAGSPSGIAVSAGGAAYVTLLDKNEIARFAAAAPTTLASSIPVAVQPMHVVFNRAGTTAFVAASDLDRWAVYSLDVASGTLPFARPMFGPPYQVALSRDESRLFVLTFGDPARVYSVPLTGLLGAQSFIVQIPGKPRALAVSPTTGALFVATSTRVARLDPATLEIQAITGPVFVDSEDVVVPPDGSRVWFGSLAGNLVALDASSLDKVAEVAHGADVYGLAMSPDGAQLWATSLGELLVVDPSRGSIVTRLTLGGTAAHIAFDRAGTTAFVANESGWVDVIR
jgi:DNA-binding beta-propeller fold protein YncE